MRSLLVVSFVLVLPRLAAAQSATTGALRGRVLEQATGEALAGVIVTAGDQAAITDADGSYQITQLPPTTYAVRFDLDVSHAVRKGVVVSVDSTTQLDERMQLGESIVVTAPPPMINMPSNAHEYRVGRAELEGVPHPSPTFESVVTGIGGSQNDGIGPAFSGATSLENRYIVDGIDITGLTYGNIGTPVLNEFIEELEVVTGGYNAEYGRATGGIVNIVTRSGSDQLRGSIFGTLTPGLLTAAAKVAPVNASSIDVTANQAYALNVGFEVGGPIVKGHAWWYLGVAPSVTRTDYTRTTKSETDCRIGGVGPCLAANADGEPDLDPKTGFYITDPVDRSVLSGSTKSTSVLAKITASPFEGHQGQLSLIADPSSSSSPGVLGLPSTGVKATSLTTDTAARWTAKLAGGKTEIEALIAWHRSTLDTGALDPTLNGQPLQILEDGNLGTWSALGGETAATAAGCRDGGSGDKYPLITNCPMQTTGYAIGGPGGRQHDTEDRRAARLGVIERGHLLGTHEVKAGVDLEDDMKNTARLLSGGALITNDVDAGSIRVQRWVQLAAATDTDPRYDETCSTPNTSGGGIGTSNALSFHCAYLGGTLGAPGTQIGGSTLNWAAYLQDSWQPIRALTFNVGLRYEEQRLYYANSLQGTVDPLTGNAVGSAAMTLTGNVAPRLGVTWDPTGEGRAKLYAAWGRFYESIPMDINDRSFGGEVSDIQTFTAAGGHCGQTDPRIGGPDGNGCLANHSPTSEQLIGSSGVLVAPGIQAEYDDELMAGAQSAAIPNIVVGINYTHRDLGRVIEDVSTDGANTYIIANPGEWSSDAEAKLTQQIADQTDPIQKQRLSHELALYQGIRTFDKPERNYDAVELSLQRKFAPGLYVQASYTYSRTSGNYPGSVSYDNGQIDPNISSQYDLIELLANRQGELPQDRPQSLKLDGYYTYKITAKSAIVLGTRVRAMSGAPENALAGHYLYGANESFLLPRGELGRTSFDHGVDLHVAYKRALTAKTGAELYVDFFNVYNNQGTADVDSTYAPFYKLAGNGVGGEQENANPVSGGTYQDLIWVKEIDDSGKERDVPIGRNPNFRNTVARYAPMSTQIGFRLTF